MKNLTEMSWPELAKLREQLREDLGDDDDSEDSDYDSDDGDGTNWVEADLVNTLAALDEITEAKQPAVKKDAPKSPPKGYPTDKSQYADPTNFKYPLNTASRVHSALSYFSNPDNIKKGGYSPEEQKFMWRRIIAAAKKFGIQLSDDVMKHREKLGDEVLSNESGEVNEELNEKEIVALIEKTIKEQMPQNPGGTLAQGTKGHGGMESYQATVRVPPDVEDLHNQLEAFKKQHAADTEAFGKKHEDFAKSNKDLSDKVDALTKGLKAMQESMAEDTDTDSEDSEDSDDTEDSEDVEEVVDSDSEDSDSDDAEVTESKEAKETAANPPANTKGKKTEAKKVKERAQTAQAEGLVATSEMAEGTGTTPPGFAAHDDDTSPKSFGDIMNKATRLRRRGIGGA